MRDVASRLAWLATCTAEQARVEWVRVTGDSAPAVPLDLLRRLVAQAIQEKRWGKLSAADSRDLDRVGQGGGGAGSPTAPMSIAPGTRLLRSWNGRTISVLATDNGFVWEGRAYRSLSQIAREVTGAHWSGPRFFGLVRHG